MNADWRRVERILAELCEKINLNSHILTHDDYFGLELGMTALDLSLIHDVPGIADEIITSMNTVVAFLTSKTSIGENMYLERHSINILLLLFSCPLTIRLGALGNWWPWFMVRL